MCLQSKSKSPASFSRLADRVRLREMAKAVCNATADSTPNTSRVFVSSPVRRHTVSSAGKVRVSWMCEPITSTYY